MIIAETRPNQTMAQPNWGEAWRKADSDRAMFMRLRTEREVMVGLKWPEPSEPSPEAIELSGLVGERTIAVELDATTDHGWLVVMGHFAQALGLVSALAEVPLEQRHGPNGPPQTKLIEFLVGILGGLEYLQDLNHSAQPIATDAAVAQAWGQTIFSHYAQVSRTLAAADEGTLEAVVEVLRQVAAPFIQAAVLETLKHSGHLTLDIDLSGREVSPTSTDYAEATFGWMDEGVHKGYQAAISSLVSERWGRVLLSLQRYSGRTLSAACLQAAVHEVETLLQVRPRRRVELVETRRQDLSGQVAQLQTQAAQAQQHQAHLWRQIGQAKAEIKRAQAEVTRLEAEYQTQGWVERPHSQLAKARRKLAAARKRQTRAWRDLDQGRTHLAWLQTKIHDHQADLLILENWAQTLDTDNLTNPNPPRIIIRLDAGFSTGANLTWLIEMGYTVLTKIHQPTSTDRLRRQLAVQPVWTRVGHNAEAVALTDDHPHDCPYPLQAMLVRYHLPDHLKYTTLLFYDDTPPPALPDWFRLYNARQIIEAGIKEQKGVFTLKRHLVRSPIGMQLQEQFALFSANFVRWAAAWVKDLLAQAHPNFKSALSQVKTLVRVVAHAKARWLRTALGNLLVFDDAGPFAGTMIVLAGQVTVQLPLPLFSFRPVEPFPL